MMKKHLLTILLTLSFSICSSEIPLTDKNIAYRGILYPQISEKTMTPYRFPHDELFPKKFSDRPSYSTKAGQSRTGASILIKTNSPKLTLGFKYKGAQFGTFFVRQNEGPWLSYKMIQPKGSHITIRSESPGDFVEYCVVGPASQPMYSLTEVQIEDGCTLIAPSPKKEKVYVALGDSISHGLRKDNTMQTWTWMAAEKLNMEFYNISIGGSNTNVGQLVPLSKLPRIDIITLLWGYNDCINRAY